jgi:AcrR family transcriptional regulator
VAFGTVAFGTVAFGTIAFGTVTAVSQGAAYRDGVLLTRNRIIAAAMELIEAEGLQAASMTRLATELGCGLIPLYSHVPSTSALLDGIAATIMSGVGSGCPADAGWADAGWADQIRAQVRAMRQAARVYPRCSAAVAGREPATAAMLRPAEHALTVLAAAGFRAPDAARIVRALAAYLTGSLVREAGARPGFDCEDDQRPRLRPADFPQLTGLTADLTRADPDADFELGLDLFVRGMDAMLAVRAGG